MLSRAHNLIEKEAIWLNIDKFIALMFEEDPGLKVQVKEKHIVLAGSCFSGQRLSYHYQ
ncbi:hypothetical protein K3495_g11141 [Podosphaera aphanis]|nr:hypothetical protein K3495_g11141 [Podosphaera aphanis]